jgi:hypothetical protein
MRLGGRKPRDHRPPLLLLIATARSTHADHRRGDARGCRRGRGGRAYCRGGGGRVLRLISRHYGSGGRIFSATTRYAVPRIKSEEGEGGGMGLMGPKPAQGEVIFQHLIEMHLIS